MGKAGLYELIGRLEAEITQCQLDISKLQREIEELEMCKADRMRAKDEFGINMQYRSNCLKYISNLSNRAKTARVYYDGMNADLSKHYMLLSDMESALVQIQKEINDRNTQIGNLYATINACDNQIYDCRSQIAQIELQEAEEEAAAQAAQARGKR